MESNKHVISELRFLYNVEVGGDSQQQLAKISYNFAEETSRYLLNRQFTAEDLSYVCQSVFLSPSLIYK